MQKNTNKERKLTDRALLHHNARVLANQITRYLYTPYFIQLIQ